VLAQAQTPTTAVPQHFTIFDEIGQMAAGMANIHVAIPLNLSTFTTQYQLIQDYLFKLSRVVDETKPEKETFMQSIREISLFGQARLKRMYKRVQHLDSILPIDTDIRSQQRQKRHENLLIDLDDDELIDVESYLRAHHVEPLPLDDIIFDALLRRKLFAKELDDRINEIKRIHKLRHHHHRHEHGQLHSHHRQKRNLYSFWEKRDRYFALENQTIELNGIIELIQNDTDRLLIETEKLQQQSNFLNRTLNNTANTPVFNTPIQPWDELIHEARQLHYRQKRDLPLFAEIEKYNILEITNHTKLIIQAFKLIRQLLIAKDNYMNLAISVQHQHKARQTHKEFFTLDEIFKQNFSSTIPLDHSRNKRMAPFLAFGAISGILGTFLGIYSVFEIEHLKTQLNDQARNHNLLVHVTKKQEEQIHKITENMNAICSLIKLMVQYNPALIAAQISNQLDLYDARLTRAVNAVQELQNRRLSVDLLDTYQMLELQKAVLEVAKERGYTVLPERLTDFFQLETSYLRQGNDILILLHVPCVVHEQLLTIYRYIPFPYPLSTKIQPDSTTISDALSMTTRNMTIPMKTESDDATIDALIITPEADLIAVGKNRRYKVLSESDLSSCIRRNRVYLCEKHQVLHTDLATSCLGSIYDRNAIGVRNNCKLIRKQLKETVYQISANDHLLFTPRPYTTQLECKNGTHFPLYLEQTTKLHIPDDCSVALLSHSIQSDYTIRISPEPLHVPWAWDPLSLPADLLLDAALIDRKLNTLDKNLKDLANETSSATDFHAMMNSKFSDPMSFPWFIWAAIIASVLGLSILILWYCYNAQQERKYQRLIKQQHVHLQPLLPPTAPQPQQPEHPTANSTTPSLYPPVYAN